MAEAPSTARVRAHRQRRRRGVFMVRVWVEKNSNREGYFVGRAQMILGLLYKAKKKRALALQHLAEAQRIISQFGQTPILARINAALAELG
jgi:hypothetical protein